MFTHAREHEHDPASLDRPVDMARKWTEWDDSFVVVEVDGLREKMARVIYSFDPAVTPWGGDVMGFDARHWIAEEHRDTAYAVTEAVLAVLGVGEMEGDR
jgi:hypothetical protein